MSENHRQVSNNDIMDYHFQNQALLKTILSVLEEQSVDPQKAQLKNLETYKKFLKDAEYVFSENTLIK